MSGNKVIQFVLARMIWFILLLVISFFGWRVGFETYLAPSNLINILLHASVLGVLTIGQTMCLLSGNFDLSAEGTMSLVIVLAAWLMLPIRGEAFLETGGGGWLLSPFLVVPIMLVVGAVVGVINGTLISRLNMNNYTVTLSMQLILRGLGTVISMGAIMPGTPPLFNWLGGGRVGTIPVSVVFTVVLYAVFAYVLKNYRFGRELYAVGGNLEAALASGFRPKRMITWSYGLSGLMAAFAGWMLLGRLEVSVATLGTGMTLETVAAAVIGGVALTGGAGTIWGAFSGVLLLSVVGNGLNLMDVDPFAVNAVRGLIILIALFIDAQKVRYKPQLARSKAPPAQQARA